MQAKYEAKEVPADAQFSVRKEPAKKKPGSATTGLSRLGDAESWPQESAQDVEEANAGQAP